MLVWTTTRAASRELTVNHHGWHTANAVLLGLRRPVGLMHVVDHDFMRRTDQSFDDIDCFLAC